MRMNFLCRSDVCVHQNILLSFITCANHGKLDNGHKVLVVKNLESKARNLFQADLNLLTALM